MVFEDFSTKEELLSMISLKGKTRGLDIFTEFKTYIYQNELPLYKLVSMTTDGAPAMTGIHNGFIDLCHKDEDFPDFMHFVHDVMRAFGKLIKESRGNDIAITEMHKSLCLFCSTMTQRLKDEFFGF